MKFGEFDPAVCEGAILAHSIRVDQRLIKKGSVLSKQDIIDIEKSGKLKILAAVLEEDDFNEDAAAQAIASALSIKGISTSAAGTGRVNFHADNNGIFEVNKTLVDAINAIDPGITFATLNDKVSVLAGRMVATVKIIPFGISAKSIALLQIAVKNALAMQVHSYQAFSIGVISTILPSLKEKTILKTMKVLEDRLKPSMSKIVAHTMVGHDQKAVSEAIGALAPKCDMLIVFGASAISDEADIIPAALKSAGGHVERVGMPVDPGNLLMLGEISGKPVIGAPGCARSPADNGFDFVLNRLLAKFEVTSDNIAAMGVGGLLMEIGSRPQPRIPAIDHETRIAAVILAGGQSRRMGEVNKLIVPINGKPMVCHPVEAAILAGITAISVVTGHQADGVQKALKDYDVKFVANPDYADGLSTSLKAGIEGVDDAATHALILLGDMPEISSDGIEAMIQASKTDSANRIVVATNHGKRGNPVLWPRAYFEQLTSITGDTGARHIIGQNSEHVQEVEFGNAASLDIDTLEALDAYRSQS